MLARHFEKSPLPMLECDARLNLLSWNAAAERLLGDHLSDLLRQSLLVALFGDDLMQSAPASIQRAARENTPKSVAAKFVDLQMQPHSGTFHITPHYKDYPSVLARIDTLHPGSFRNFLERKWREIAPKAQVRAYDAARKAG